MKRFKSYSLNRQTHRRTDGQTDRQTDRQMDRWTDGQTDRQTDGQTDRRTDTTENITYPHSRVLTWQAGCWVSQPLQVKDQ